MTEVLKPDLGKREPGKSFILLDEKTHHIPGIEKLPAIRWRLQNIRQEDDFLVKSGKIFFNFAFFSRFICFINSYKIN